MNRARIAVLAATVAALAAAFFALRARSTPGAATAGASAGAAAGAPRGTAGPVTFAIAGRAEDHCVPEPCSGIPSGGLLSMKAFFDAAAKVAPPVVPIFLGDATATPGELGRAIGAHHYPEIVQASDPKIVAAGARDLALGSGFVRSVLAARPFPVLCANATDAAGSPLLRGEQLVDTDGRTLLFVGSIAQSLQDEIAADGSDVRLLPERDAVATAVAEGEARAKQLERTIAARVLLHHGTVDETAALLRQVRGFTLAVAARGGDLPAENPRVEGGVPILDAGRGLRFGWLATAEGGKTVRWSLMRIGGVMLAAGSPVSETLAEHPPLMRDFVFPKLTAGDDARTPDPRGSYVGSQRCATCHSEECGEHDQSLHRKLPDGFGDDALGNMQCAGCHVTGAYRRTGWKGKDDTSDLAGVSCEACHGPGSAHAEAPGTPYGRFDLAQCRTCHTPDRSPAFDANALWERWKHGLRR